MNDFENFLNKLGLIKLGDLTYDKLLGVGGQAPVCSYRYPNGEAVAVKLLIGPQTKSTLLRFRDEVSALKRCAKFGNPVNTIVTSRSDIQKVRGLPIHYFLLDVAPGESLATQIKRTPPPWKWSDALRMIWRISWALSQAHIAGYTHRDLHPGNIFCDDSALQLTSESHDGHPGIYILDFGVRTDVLAALFGSEKETAHTFRPVGSVLYASPEALNDPSSVKQASDMWALGVLLYQLLFGAYPFQEPTLRKLMDATSIGYYSIPQVKGASAEEEKFTLNVLDSLLNPVPNRRFNNKNLTTVIYDALYLKSIPIIAADLKLWQLYFSCGGDLWICPRCSTLVHPDGSRCTSCGIMNDDWLKWL